MKHVVSHAMEVCGQDLEFFNKFYDKQLLERLQRIKDKPFVRVSGMYHREYVKPCCHGERGCGRGRGRAGGGGEGQAGSCKEGFRVQSRRAWGKESEGGGRSWYGELLPVASRKNEDGASKVIVFFLCQSAKAKTLERGNVFDLSFYT